MTGTRPVHRRRSLEVVEATVAVRDAHEDGGTDRMTESDAGEELRMVGLDLLPASPSVAPLPAAEFGVDQFRIDLETAGQSLDRGVDAGTMGFTGGLIGELRHGVSFARVSSRRIHRRIRRPWGRRRPMRNIRRRPRPVDRPRRCRPACRRRPPPWSRRPAREVVAATTAIEKHDDGTAHAIDGEFVHAGRARVVEARVTIIGPSPGSDRRAERICSPETVASGATQLSIRRSGNRPLPAVALAVGGGPDSTGEPTRPHDRTRRAGRGRQGGA